MMSLAAALRPGPAGSLDRILSPLLLRRTLVSRGGAEHVRSTEVPRSKPVASATELLLIGAQSEQLERPAELVLMTSTPALLMAHRAQQQF